MNRSDQQVVQLVYQSWADLDRSIGGLSDTHAVTRAHGGSSIAWTVGHLTQMVDSWLNVRFQALPPHPAVSSVAFATGSIGDATDWTSTRDALVAVQSSARRFLDALPEGGLDHTVPYTGSIEWLRPVGLQLRYAVLRIAAHHFGHVAEILFWRSQLGVGLRDDREWGQFFI